jgi:NAD(P)-dependent dehydrogenase (short-subunit alcohol dehydrogenase family)
MAFSRSQALTSGIAFVTGGARGLGNAIAVSFAKEGARGVAIVDIGDESTFAKGAAAISAAAAAPDFEVISITANVTVEADMERAVQETVAKFGRIDYAANFAGIAGPMMATWDMDLDQWKGVINVNAVGVFISNKYQLQQMIKQEPLPFESGRMAQRGSIVNCASVNATQAGAGASGYTAAKHAVAGMTKATALEARGLGVRVNAVSPGFIRTNLLDTAMANGVLSDSFFAGCEARQGRMVLAEEVGDAVVMLSCGRMSAVTGANLAIDNGFTINEMET